MAQKAKIILVDDEPEILEMLEGLLKSEGYDVWCTQSGTEAIELFKQKNADVVVTDIRMPGMDGLEVLRRVKAMDSRVEVVVLTGHASVEIAISAFKNDGAFDFLTKPLERLEDFLICIEKAVAKRNLILKNALLLEELSQQQIHLENYNKALKASEQRYRSFVENFKGIAFHLEADGSPVFYHGAVEETTGYTESQLVHNRPRWETLIHPDELELVQSRRRMLCASVDRNITHEYRIRHRNRQWRWIREHIQSLYDSDRRAQILHGVVFDITDYKNLQAQYTESRKLDAIATMAGGIAHQFNNFLAGLMGNLELLEMDVDRNSSAANYIEPMMKMIKGMTQLTSQLLAYARGGKYLPSKLSAHDLVRQSISLIEHRLSGKFELKLDLCADEDHIIADSTQMQMVILAVMENALEAMGEGGVITILSTTVEIKKEMVKGGCTQAPGRYICLSIKDNGCGMTKDTAKKIFDPFFTTKFIGRGLGLSAAYGIIFNHNGWMEVDTKLDMGTQIQIYLPLTESRISHLRSPEPEQISRGNAAVLVVEDEKAVMQAIHKLLKRLGYRVLEALTGQAALEVLETHKSRIDVVLLDVKLPDADAEDLYDKMLKINPHLKVIVCSGYNKDGPVEKLLASGATAFLQKPFSVSQLSAELKSAIKNNKTAENDKAAEKSRLKVV